MHYIVLSYVHAKAPHVYSYSVSRYSKCIKYSTVDTKVKFDISFAVMYDECSFGLFAGGVAKMGI